MSGPCGIMIAGTKCASVEEIKEVRKIVDSVLSSNNDQKTKRSALKFMLGVLKATSPTSISVSDTSIDMDNSVDDSTNFNGEKDGKSS